MKNTKIARALALLCSAVIFFTGCAARTPVTSKDFKTKAEAAGFSVKEQTPSSTDITEFMVATDTEADAETDFVVYKTEQNAITVYNKLKESIKAMDTAAVKNVDSIAYSKYTVENGELYYVLVRMNNTIAYAKCQTKQKDKTDSLFRAMKY